MERRGTTKRSTQARAAVTSLAALALATACHRGGRANGGKELAHGGVIASDAAAPPSAPTSRPGMAYVPAGTLLGGTPVDRAPRVPEEELPGTPIPMSAYFIDVLPYPDEEGAIATTNVTREEAAKLCEAKGKRLCSELEWERACKGPTNTTYETGDDYRAATCALGATAEISAKRPTGELTGCVSGFGMREAHGGAWEWTDGAWGRGGRKDLGVLKGGNAVAGEIAGRCANSLARAPTTKSPSMGFRCCAGPTNEANVELTVKVEPALERSMKTADLAGPWLAFARATWPLRSPDALGASPFKFVHAFVWHPVGNETLVVASGCAIDAPRSRCGLLVGRAMGTPGAGDGATADAGTVRVLLHVDTGHEAAEVAEAGEAKHLRFKGYDATSAFLRDFTYAYGRIELGPIRR